MMCDHSNYLCALKEFDFIKTNAINYFENASNKKINYFKAN